MSNKYGYEISKLSQMETRNGVAFTVVLSLAGKPTLVAENSGNGGCNTYDQSDPNASNLAAEKDKLVTTAKQWGKDVGESPFEIEDAFVEALMRNYDEEHSKVIVYKIGDDFPRAGSLDSSSKITKDQIRTYLKKENPSQEIKIWDTHELKFK